MTGSGDGLNFDFLDEPTPSKAAPEKAPPPPAAKPPAPPADEDLSLDLEFEALPDDTGSSIFDDPVSTSIQSVDEIPDPVPNVSDGTEILVRGRTEVQEFSEEFTSTFEPASPLSPLAPDMADGLADLLGGNELPSTTPLEPEWAEPEPPAPPAEPIGSGLDWEPESPEEPATVIDMSWAPAAPTPATAQPADGIASPLSLPNDVEEGPSLSGLMAPAPSPPDLPETPAPPVAETPPAATLPPESDLGMSLDSLTDSTITSASVAGAVAATASRPSTATAPGGNRTILMALAGYALLVTVLCLYLMSQVAKARSGNTLESLPDVRQVLNIPVNSILPPGHTLAIGDKQRFGNLRVEPLRVTSGPLKVVHFSAKSDSMLMKNRVLKLWVRLTNESKDQTFVPLDREIVFKRHYQNDQCFANNFIVPSSRKVAGGPIVFVYDHPETSQWDLDGQNLGKTLAPGESWETYIPTTEDGIEELRGELLWRVHLRKGLSPNGGGVTTLVEVAFRDDQITHEG